MGRRTVGWSGIRRAIALGFALWAIVVQPSAVFAADWWGRKLPDGPTQFIFGYGSLISSASRNATAATPVQAIPVRVSAALGYRRTWNDRARSGFTALGLRKVEPGEAGSTINGVLYPVVGDDMSRFDAREANYTRVEVKLSDMEAVDWQRLPESGHVWVYVPTHQGSAPGEGLPVPDPGFPLLQSYIDVVIEGGLEYGDDFAREIVETTDGWSRYWLNDRELARRPWVHDPKAVAVDRLLRSTAPASAAVGERQFPEAFAIRWLAVPAK